DIGYNFLVDRFGRIWEGRQGGIDQPVIGAQAQGWNDDSTGISNIGTFSAVAQTPEAIEANARLIAWKLSVHGAPVEGAVPLVSGGGPENNYPAGTVVPFQRISGHRDVGKTECPGGALYAQLPQIRARAAQIAPEYANVKGRLTLARSASAVRYGDTLTLTGQLHRFDGSPVVGVAVWAQKRGTSSWVPMTKGFTSADGSYSITIPWRASGRLRTHAVVDDGIAVSAAATVECIPQLSQMKKARVARRATVKGKVRPAETFKVLLERQTGGRYRKIGTYSVKARKSAFKAKLPLRRAGRYKLTPVVKIGTKTFKGKSALLRALG
ncbi:MAG TPA: peptidoglycan recognition family protein, partial [Baekduia sp.]|nr:peptidoglycan recognition family protein [Baekduia sp.]